jgi:hypothetical protein
VQLQTGKQKAETNKLRIVLNPKTALMIIPETNPSLAVAEV